jgi:hypothetical protein
MNVLIGKTQYSGTNPPNICPHCHVVNTPHKKYEEVSQDTDNTNCNYQVWKCSNQDCLKLFGVLFKVVDGKAKITNVLNGLPKGPDWPKPIEELLNGKTVGTQETLKSKFIKTYLQSLEAESYGLDEIAGMGYRKAIEYLVKDWAIQNTPDDKDKILGKWLGSTISDYYEGDLKDILERATWLGNDQAHYNKLFEEYDIDVLKELIDLIMVELDREYKKRHYIEKIQRRK